MSAQPRVTTPACPCEPTTAESYGSVTSQTDRFAAGLLDATRSVTRAVPERCTVSASGAVAYSRRVRDCARLAFALPLTDTLSTSVSAPVAALVVRRPTPLPPRVPRSVTGTEPGSGYDAYGRG